jgi:predicted Rossmann fold flavoprotein
MHDNPKAYDLLVIGGGAAGFFGAIACAEARPGTRVAILEATGRVLTKVKVSGGGRCNVTHNCFDPKVLVRAYPRGHKELLGAFHKFGPKDTIEWFARKSVRLKAEEDGRMFPVTDSSQTIIDCLTGAATAAGVELKTRAFVESLEKIPDGFRVSLKGAESLTSKKVLLATGSVPSAWALAKGLGHSLIAAVPSLFTFEIEDPLLSDLPGLSFPRVRADLQVNGESFLQEGPLLITHWGLSGPAVLKLSAFAARALAETAYQGQLFINFESDKTADSLLQDFQACKGPHAKKKLTNHNPLSAPRRFWEKILELRGLDKSWADVSKIDLQGLAEAICRFPFQVKGKGVFKEEFVTAGGVDRSEIDFRSFQSKLCPGLYFAGELLDIDGITGGFNFQNAWTGGYLAGQSVAAGLS